MPHSLTKLLVGVYPRNISEELAANLSLSLPDIKLTVSSLQVFACTYQHSPPPPPPPAPQGEATTIVPPLERGEEEFQLEWEKIGAGVSGLPVQYPLNLRGPKADESDDEEDIPIISLICHKVRVQRHPHMESTTVTVSWEE